MTRTVLHAPSPNPFNPRTSLSFDLRRESRVTLELYDLRGRRVRSLLSERWPAGRHRVEWAGVDDRGAKVASGVYFAHFAAGGVSSAERMVLLK